MYPMEDNNNKHKSKQYLLIMQYLSLNKSINIKVVLIDHDYCCLF